MDLVMELALFCMLMLLFPSLSLAQIEGPGAWSCWPCLWL